MDVQGIFGVLYFDSEVNKWLVNSMDVQCNFGAHGYFDKEEYWQ